MAAPRSLLLLPPPPSPLSPESISAAYRPALAAALQQTAQTQTASATEGAVLVVAVHASPKTHKTHKHVAYADAQALLAALYALTVVLGRALDIGTGTADCTDGAVDGTRSVDVRIVLDPFEVKTAFGALWTAVFYPETDDGLALLKVVSDTANAVAVPAGDAPTDLTTPTLTTPTDLAALHSTVCLGGTFDYLHPGHKLLLSAGALLLDTPGATPDAPCEYVVGITGDALLRNKKYADLVQPWPVRARAVAAFLQTVLDWHAAPVVFSDTDDTNELTLHVCGGAVRVSCVRIDDAFGPTVERRDISCLVVSGETRAGGDAVNAKRRSQGWPALETFVVDVLNADGMAAASGDTFDAKISSSEIRKQRAQHRNSTYN